MDEVQTAGTGTTGALSVTSEALDENAVIDLRGTDERPLATFVDPRSGFVIEMHHPLESPGRWRSYLDGAEARYESFGVAQVVDRDALADGRRVALFFVAIDPSGRVAGGIRAHGPLRVVPEAYALDELRGHPRLSEVRGLLARTIPLGLIEVKGAWTDPDLARPGVSDALARCHVHAMGWLGARFALCTCSDTVARRWSTAGGRPFGDLDPVPFPDDRYRTVMLWWDHDHLAERATEEQWQAIGRESHDILAGARGQLARRTPADPEDAYRAELLDDQVLDDAARLLELRADASVQVLDQLAAQRRALQEILVPNRSELLAETPRWAYFPWRRTLVRILGPGAFRAVRLDRNRNKVTPAEQERLAQLRVGVVGLSVGHAIAHTLALEGACGSLRLADFDEIELSNLNRIPASLVDLGSNKAVAVGRRIAELDPYLELHVERDGLTADNLDGFVASLDVVIEECDSLDVKAMVRDRARRARVPVLMETSDRGLLDVERFDLEPDRALFHGLLGDVQAADLIGLSTHDKVPHVLRILEPEQLSSRMAASMAEIDETVTTWPQLGGDVMLGGATVAAAVRALALGRPLPSGRVRVDLHELLAGIAPPPVPVDAVGTATDPDPDPVPADPRLAVAHAAHTAPSGGNVQPWRLRVDDAGLHVELDRSCSVAMDVAYRGSYVAAGAAILNARIAAAALGVLGEVELLPHGADADLLGTLRWGSGDDAQLAALHPAVLRRATNRREGRPRPLPATDLQVLDDAVRAEGARLHLLTDRSAVTEYAELLAESDRIRFLSPQLHAEMMSELRWPGIDSIRTGIDVRTLEFDPADLAKLSVARRADVMAELASWNGGRALGEVTRDRVVSSSAVAAVSVADGAPGSLLRGGAAVERLWLVAEGLGLGVQPVSPVSVFAVEDGEVDDLVPAPFRAPLRQVTHDLRRLLGVTPGRSLALVVRLSHTDPPTTLSRRRPLVDVVDASR